MTETADIKMKMKVLIVDDHPLTLQMLRQVLKALGFPNIVEADDGDKALDLLHDGHVSLVFTDLNMPTLSGFDLIRKIREQPGTRELPVIVVSGVGDHDMVIKAMQTGADSFVVKPFAAETIKGKITQVLSKRAHHLTAPA